MASKRSRHELKRLLATAVAEACRFPRPGLWFCVDEIDVIGNLPERLQVWATLHFLPTGSPFCCGEPGCHLAIWQERSADIGDHLRRAMGLRQTVTVDFGERIAVNFHAGVEFNYGQSLVAG